MYEHKKKMEQLRQKGQEKVDSYWDQEYVSDQFGPSKYKGKTKREIKQFMIDDLNNKKNEIEKFEDEILKLNAILIAQNKIVDQIEGKYFVLMSRISPTTSNMLFKTKCVSIITKQNQKY